MMNMVSGCIEMDKGTSNTEFCSTKKKIINERTWNQEFLFAFIGSNFVRMVYNTIS